MAADEYVQPETARRILCLTDQTLRSWAKEGKIDFIRTVGGHRRYKIKHSAPEEQKTERRKICYARVSSSSQKEDLERQIASLRSQFPTHDVISDVGSGLNFKRKGLRAILELALQGSLQELVVTYKDRLTRFGFELIQTIVHFHKGKIVVLNREEEQTPEQELCQDLIAITTVFTARIHGFRSGRNNIKKHRDKDGEKREE
jgi:predicted site-specific integrase-resolvase